MTEVTSLSLRGARGDEGQLDQLLVALAGAGVGEFADAL